MAGMNWRVDDFSDPDRLFAELGPRELAAIDRLMASLPQKDMPFQMIDGAMFTDPDLDPFMATVLDRIADGSGLVILRGLPVERYGLADMERIYWGLGTHLGKGNSQSALGDYLGYVRDETKPGEPESARGYIGRRELSPHTDLSEIVGLLCIRGAREGGESAFVSGLTLYDVVAAEHPEYLAVLERGFPYHRRGEEAPDAEPITPYDVPVFSTKDGVRSCFFVRGVFDVAFRDMGRAFTALELAALGFLEEVMTRPDVCLRIKLEPGDAAFLNNRTVLHARSEFTDWDEPERKRLYFRLWLESKRQRPVVDEIHIYQNASGELGVDPQPGRLPATPNYSVLND